MGKCDLLSPPVKKTKLLVTKLHQSRNLNVEIGLNLGNETSDLVYKLSLSLNAKTTRELDGTIDLHARSFSTAFFTSFPHNSAKFPTTCQLSRKKLYRALIRMLNIQSHIYPPIDVCSPVLPKEFNVNQPKTIRLYPLSNYTFGAKEQQPEEDPSVVARLKRLEEHYEKHGMRRTCEGILVCHEHNHPHILMLQIANAFFKLCV